MHWFIRLINYTHIVCFIVTEIKLIGRFEMFNLMFRLFCKYCIFLILPYCNRRHHVRFEMNRTIINTHKVCQRTDLDFSNQKKIKNKNNERVSFLKSITQTQRIKS